MKDPDFAKSVVFINCLVPVALLSWQAYVGELGANPVASFVSYSGILALVFLMLSLAITPVRLITGWNFLSHFRRMLGLFAFFHALLHLGTYFFKQQGGSVRNLFEEAMRSRFIFLGMAALLLMTPLAATSTNGIIKAMGAKKWKALHRLAYVCAILAVMHFWMGQKADVRTPGVFAIVLAGLLGYRGYRAMRKPRVSVPSGNPNPNPNLNLNPPPRRSADSARLEEELD